MAVAEKSYVASVLPLTLRVVIAPFILSVIVPLCFPGVEEEYLTLTEELPVAPTTVGVTLNPVGHVPVTCWL